MADPAAARDVLGWSATRSRLDRIVRNALKWELAPRYGKGRRVAVKEGAG